MAFEGSTLSTAEVRVFTGGVISETFAVGFVDVDMMAVNLVGGFAYNIDVDSGNDSYLRVFDQFGIEVKANDDGAGLAEVAGTFPFTQFVANYTGRFYIAFSPFYMTGYDPTTTLGRVSPEDPLGGVTSTLTVTELGSQFAPDANSIAGIAADDINDESDAIGDADRRIRVEYAAETFVSSLDIEMGRYDLLKGDTLVFDLNGQTSNVLDGIIRVFTAGGSQIGIDNGSGSGEDSELVFSANATGTYYVAVSGEGNSTYNALDGTGTLAGDTGLFQLIVHRNPTGIGTSLTDSLVGDTIGNYLVLLAGNDTAFGNDGNDTLAGGDDQDGLNGGNGNDMLYGEHGNDTMLGEAGNDVITGGLGNDSADGGLGTDILVGDTGNDTLRGGRGNFADTLNGGAGDDSLIGNSGSDRLDGGDGNDSMAGNAHNDTLLGGAGTDTLDGGTEDDLIDGGADNDILRGGEDNDFIVGGTGADSLEGQGGLDTLWGGEGNDTLNGGGAVDSFVFISTAVSEGVDLVQSFQLGLEDIDLSQIFLTTGSVVNAGNLAQFVQTSTAGLTDSFLGVDADGVTGGLNFVIIAQVANISAAQLFDINNFLV